MSSEPISTSTFTSDMTTNSWDNAIPSVPFPAPLALPDTENILAELNLYTSAMSTPLPCETSPDSHNGLFRNPQATNGVKRPLSAPVNPIQWNKKSKIGKHEDFFVTEPLTPTNHSKPTIPKVPKITVTAPLSPTCQSVCTEEADEVRSMPPTPIPCDSSRLPQFSKEQSRKRRAIRRAALKKSRSRKEEGIIIKTEPTTKSENETTSSGEPIDKKAARAIRNREAAMKSRVEAKEKMKKLQNENESLSTRVKSLSEENKMLTAQLKNLLQHTLGVKMNEDTDVKNVFNMFARINGDASNTSTTTN